MDDVHVLFWILGIRRSRRSIGLGYDSGGAPGEVGVDMFNLGFR